MINFEDVVKFIEKSNNIKLYDYQKKLLKNLIDGKITDCPRGCGKSTVINGYAKYLDYLHNSCKISIKADNFISGDEFLDEVRSMLPVVKAVFKTSPDRARRDFNLEFTSPYLILDEGIFLKKEGK